MKSSELNAFLVEQMTGKKLSSLLHDDVSTYRKLLEKKGATVPIKFYEDEDVFINETAVKKLLQEVLDGSVSNIDLAYICDCLTLGDRVEFVSEEIKDIIFETADPEINGGYKSNVELLTLLHNIVHPT